MLSDESSSFGPNRTRPLRGEAAKERGGALHARARPQARPPTQHLSAIFRQRFRHAGVFRASHHPLLLTPLCLPRLGIAFVP